MASRQVSSAAAALALAGAPAAAADVRVSAPSRDDGATIARIVAPVAARSAPGARRVRARLGVATEWSGQPQSLLVLASAERDGRQWLEVLLPMRPNGSSGWIPRDRAQLSRTRYWITVRKRRRLVAVFHRGALVRSFGAVIGKRSTPTPHGLAAVYEINRQPNPGGFLGPWALPLTLLSEQLRSYGGGPGRVAIHGRAGASFQDPLGSAASHGCIRIDNEPVAWLARRVPRGAPIRIRR